MKRKSKIYLLIFIMFVVAMLAMASYAYITRSSAVGQILNAETSTADNIGSFVAYPGGEININITASDMSEGNADTNYTKNSIGYLNVEVTSAASYVETECTFDLVWVWDSEDKYTKSDVDLPYTHTDGKVYPYEMSILINDGEEKDFSSFNWNEKGEAIILEKEKVTSRSTDEPTKKAYKVETRVYNLPVEQNLIQGKNYRAHLEIRNNECSSKDSFIDKVELVSLDTSLVSSVRLVGTAQDRAMGIVGYAYTQSSDNPTSWTNVNRTNEEISIPKTVTTNGDWYFWVKDARGNIEHKKVTLDNIGVVKTTTLSLYEENGGTSTLSDSKTISEMDAIDKVTVNQGSVTYTVNNKTVNVTASGGSQSSSSRSGTCTSNPKVSGASSCSYCTGYSCPYGGSLSGSRCSSTSTTHSYSQSGYCTCSGSKRWLCTYSNYVPACSGTPSYSCSSGAGGGSCSIVNDTMSSTRNCSVTCTMPAYNATCNGTGYYSCCSSGTLSGGSCYTCSQGSFSSSTKKCSYSCQIPYTYYSYSITIYYIVKS